MPPKDDALAAATCRPVDTTELPRLGGPDGAWLTPSRLALLDFNRFLVYDLDRDSVLAVDPSAEGADSLQPLDLTVIREGFAMIATDPANFSKGLLLQLLDLDLKPIRTYSWPPEWGDDVHYYGEDLGLGRPIVALEIIGTENGVVSWLSFANPKRTGIIDFALPARNNGDSVLTPIGSWLEMPTESHALAPLLPARLVVTTGEYAAAYALRVDDEPFIQRLTGEGERLRVFPKWPGPLPSLPPLVTSVDSGPWWAAVEEASFPAGLYAQGPHLYLLVRLAGTGGAKWDLHAIDPVAEVLLHRVRLPTRAVHVSLVPGPDHWALIEGSSHSEDEHRQPKRLLLLDSDSIRSGAELMCN